LLESPESSFTPNKRFIIWTSQYNDMVSLLENALEANSHAKPLQESISGTFHVAFPQKLYFVFIPI
jgi:hypothetical protein